LRSLKHLENNRNVSREWISARQRLKEMENVAYRRSVASGGGQVRMAEAVRVTTKLTFIEDVYTIPLARESGRYCTPQAN